MRIVELHAENIKRIKAVDIVPKGDVVQITGRNASGKTSVLDAIWWALAGQKNIQDLPIRTGSRTARIKLDLGEIIVTRTFTATDSTLTVEGAQGNRFGSPQRMLDAMIGALTFDPLEFSRLKPKDQLEKLRGLVTLDVDVDALDAANQDDYDHRAQNNRDIKALQVQADAIAVDEFMLPAEKPDLKALMDELEQVQQHNARVEQLEGNQAGHLRRIADRKSEIADLAARIAELQARQQAATAELARLEAETLAALPAKKDTAAIRQRITDAQRINTLFQEKAKRDGILAMKKSLEGEVEALTLRMKHRTEEKAAAMARANMPVPGLSFDESGVLFNGVPFQQASSAEQLRVSLAIVMASNPQLRVVRIQDGSLLDENGLRIVEEMAAKHDFQVWVERVDSSGKIGVVIQDGTVAADHQVDAPQAERPAPEPVPFETSLDLTPVRPAAAPPAPPTVHPGFSADLGF